MNAVITHVLNLPPVPEPTDVKRQLNVTLDGVAQPPIEKANGQQFEVDAIAGQKLVASVTDISETGVKSEVGEPFELTVVDDVKPAKPGKLELVAKSKKFLATGPHS